jgi:hypothetical protein
MEALMADTLWHYGPDAVPGYLRADLQWPRHLRIAHAVYKLKEAATKNEKLFWTAILEANGYSND